MTTEMQAKLTTSPEQQRLREDGGSPQRWRRRGLSSPEPRRPDPPAPQQTAAPLGAPDVRGGQAPVARPAGQITHGGRCAEKGGELCFIGDQGHFCRLLSERDK